MTANNDNDDPSQWYTTTGSSGVYFNDGRELSLLRYIHALPNLPSLRGNPVAIVEAIDTFGRTQNFLMNIGAPKGRIITSIIEECKPKVFVELGGYVGYSAILFGDAVRKYGGLGAKYYSLEMDPSFAGIVSDLIDLAGLSDVVKVVVGPAAESIRRLHAEGVFSAGGVDMVLLDHVEDLYVQDLKVFEASDLLKKGGVVVADNCTVPGAPEYLRYVRGSERCVCESVESVIPTGLKDTMEIARMK